MPTGTAYGASALILSACLLAACTSSGSSPVVLSSAPSPSASPSVSTSAPSVASVSPVSQTPTVSSSTPSPTSTKAAVEQAVRDYYAAVNVAISTGDTKKLEVLTDPGCPCSNLITAVKKLFKTGSTSGAHWTVQSAKVKSVTGDLASTEVSYRTEKYSELDGEGKVSHTYGAVQTLASVILLRAGNWKVSNYLILSGHDVKS
jgi:hypothetical protein